MNQLKKIEGCTIETLDNVACQAYVKWVIERLKPDENLKDIAWLLAHCHDGVTWGLFDNIINDWLLSSTPFPKLCPRISESNLLEIRLFGLEREILIWRTKSGFSGRSMVDKPGQKKNDPCRPDDEIRILLGDQVMATTKDGFTRVRTKSGMEQAIPLVCTDRDYAEGRMPCLLMRHYFAQDDETGIVRVAASRLVNVFKEV
jgi:CRISPR-associated protein (TIGR03984 family)